jgi:hypothetical protein
MLKNNQKNPNQVKRAKFLQIPKYNLSRSKLIQNNKISKSQQLRAQNLISKKLTKKIRIKVKKKEKGRKKHWSHQMNK